MDRWHPEICGSDLRFVGERSIAIAHKRRDDTPPEESDIGFSIAIEVTADGRVGGRRRHSERWGRD